MSKINVKRRYVRHTKEALLPLVASSRSLSEVLTKLQLKPTGGSYANVKARIQEFGIDTSHFTGKGWAKGQKAPTRKTATQILVLANTFSPKRKASVLRRALDEIGRSHQCAVCAADETWMDKPITHQIDHINGMTWDNREENLRYLCPNCHSQTQTWGSGGTVYAQR